MHFVCDNLLFMVLRKRVSILQHYTENFPNNHMLARKTAKERKSKEFDQLLFKCFRCGASEGVEIYIDMVYYFVSLTSPYVFSDFSGKQWSKSHFG